MMLLPTQTFLFASSKKPASREWNFPKHKELFKDDYYRGDEE